MAKFDLNRDNMFLYGLSTGAVVLLVAIALMLYLPLLKNTSKKRHEYKELTVKIEKDKRLIEAIGALGSERVLLGEKEASLALSEITKAGRDIGVDFMSIVPGSIEQDVRSKFKVLPIRMRVGSSYQQIGVFLGALDSLEKVLVVVKSFNVLPKEGDPAWFITDLSVNMYLSGSEQKR